MGRKGMKPVLEFYFLVKFFVEDELFPKWEFEGKKRDLSICGYAEEMGVWCGQVQHY